MFGYIIPNKPELKVKEYNRYRACYCGLCRSLKEKYGVVGELTLTYDITFLILVLNSLYEPEESLRQCRCAVHPVRPHMEVVTECSRYGADMNLLLMYYKLTDDYADEKKLLSRMASGMLKQKVKQVEKLYPRQAAVIRKELRYLAELEHTQEASDSAVEKAARSFGRLLGSIFVWKEDLWKKDLYGMGYFLGMYIYMMDAWKDLPEDRAEGHYNPLPYDEHTTEREQKLRSMMMQIMSHCAFHMERLPLVQDVELIRNIVYSGVWMAWNAKQKKGCIKDGEGSV